MKYPILIAILASVLLLPHEARSEVPEAPASTLETACLLELQGQYDDATRVMPGTTFRLFGKIYPIALNEVPGDVCTRAVAFERILEAKNVEVQEAARLRTDAEGRATRLQKALDLERKPNYFKENYQFFSLGFFVFLALLLIKPFRFFLFHSWRFFTMIFLGWTWEKYARTWRKRAGGKQARFAKKGGDTFHL